MSELLQLLEAHDAYLQFVGLKESAASATAIRHADKKGDSIFII